jgi:hypothetical protein
MLLWGVLVAATGLIACGGDKDDPAADTGGAGADVAAADTGGTSDEVGLDDVVNVDDLLSDIGGGGGAKLGDPSTLWAQAKQTVKNTVDHIRVGVARIKDTVANTKPEATGKTKAGQPYAVWNKTKGGVDYRFVAVRTAPKRLRYVLFGKKGALEKVLLTGVFVKVAPRVGGGRLHINITGANELGDAPWATGHIHVFFANHKATAHARRIVYRKFKKVDDKAGVPWNFGVDLIRFPGKGGRLRSMSVGNILQSPATVEAAAMRVLWTVGLGGRADGVLVHLWPKPVKLIGVMHECWDGKFLRTAYKDSVKSNDANDPDEGDTTAKGSCGDFAQQDVDQGTADPGKSDGDPELDAMLKELDVDQIDEATAGDESDPEAG